MRNESARYDLGSKVPIDWGYDDMPLPTEENENEPSPTDPEKEFPFNPSQWTSIVLLPLNVLGSNVCGSGRKLGWARSAILVYGSRPVQWEGFQKVPVFVSNVLIIWTITF